MEANALTRSLARFELRERAREGETRQPNLDHAVSRAVMHALGGIASVGIASVPIALIKHSNPTLRRLPQPTASTSHIGGVLENSDDQDTSAVSPMSDETLPSRDQTSRHAGSIATWRGLPQPTGSTPHIGEVLENSDNQDTSAASPMSDEISP